MSSTDDATWYGLRPNGRPSIAVLNPKPPPRVAEAEEAAGAMRQRSPNFKLVEIVGFTFQNGMRSHALPVGGRVGPRGFARSAVG